MRLVVAILALSAISSNADAGRVPKRIEKIMARGDGSSPATAFKVRSVEDEYAVVAALNLKANAQSLHWQDKAYDVLTCTDKSGTVRELWFEINDIYPAF